MDRACDQRRSASCLLEKSVARALPWLHEWMKRAAYWRKHTSSFRTAREQCELPLQAATNQMSRAPCLRWNKQLIQRSPRAWSRMLRRLIWRRLQNACNCASCQRGDPQAGRSVCTARPGGRSIRPRRIQDVMRSSSSACQSTSSPGMAWILRSRSAYPGPFLFICITRGSRAGKLEQYILL